MAKSVKLRQGTATEHASFTGEMAEVTFDTTNNRIILHDGITPGGIQMAKLSDVPVDLTDLTDADGNLSGGGAAFSGTTYVVTVASGTNAYSTGNKYYITNETGASPTVTLTEGETYRFDQSDSTNTGHPLKFSTTANGTHDSGSEYTTGVTYNGVPGQADAYTEITVEVGAPTLYYYCEIHSGMGTGAPVQTGSTTLDITGVTYASKSFSVVSQAVFPSAVDFTPTGSKMIVSDFTTKRFFTYSLSPAWDVTTASYDGASSDYALASAQGTLLNFCFGDSGTKLYNLDHNNAKYHQHTLSTAYDVSTASADSKSLHHFSTNETPRGLAFNSDGTKCYISADKYDLYGDKPGIFEWDLSTPWDISTASYSNKTLEVSNSADYTASGDYRSYALGSIRFNSSGTQVFLVDSNGKSVHQYTLSTAWDISTASYDSKSLDISNEAGYPRGLAFDTDATKMYIVGNVNDTVAQYDTNGTWTLSSSSGNAPSGPTPIWSLSGDSATFAAVTTAKVDTNATNYVALNHPTAMGNTWSEVDGSYAIRNNQSLVNGPTTLPYNIWSTDDLSEGMTYQYYVKFLSPQPTMWEGMTGITAGSSAAYSYAQWLVNDSNYPHTLGWGSNGAYGTYTHSQGGTTRLDGQGWLHFAIELQSNGRLVHYINGVVVVNEDASDISTLTNKANTLLGSVNSWVTDIEIYTGGGIHNPDLLATPPGFTPPTRKQAPVPTGPVTGPTMIWSLSGDSATFAAVTTAKVDTNATNYVALNHPTAMGNSWSIEDGSYAMLNNPNVVNDPTVANRAFNIWSTDDLSGGLTFQYWIKVKNTQPPVWEAQHGVTSGSTQAYSYSLSQSSATSWAWAGNGAYGYFGIPGNGRFDAAGWIHIAMELQSNGRFVHYINGVVASNEDASDLSGLTNKANIYFGSVHSWVTDIEIYTDGGIHNPDLLATPPGFTPPTRKQI